MDYTTAIAELLFRSGFRHLRLRRTRWDTEANTALMRAGLRAPARTDCSTRPRTR